MGRCSRDMSTSCTACSTHTRTVACRQMSRRLVWRSISAQKLEVTSLARLLRQRVFLHSPSCDLDALGVSRNQQHRFPVLSVSFSGSRKVWWSAHLLHFKSNGLD